MRYLKEFDSIGKLQKHYKSNLYVTPNVYITNDNQKVDMTSDDEIVCVYDITDLNGNPELWGAYTNLNNLFESIVIDGVKWDNLNNPAQSSSYYDSNKSSNIHIIKFKLKVKDFSGLIDAPLVTGNHLEYVYLPEGFKTISDNMFFGCNFLKQIHIPNSLVSISTSAFYNCSSLKEIHLNDGLLSIGQNAFNGCTSLEKINFPYTLQDGVGSTYHGNFNGCTNLKHLYVDTPLFNNFYGSTSFPYTNLELLEFGPHTINSEGKLNFSFGGYSFNNVDIKYPEGLLCVPSMGGVSGVNEIILPATAREFIGGFGGCTIEKIDLSNTQISSLTYTSGNYTSNVFTGTNIKQIILNNLITDIPSSCFGGCSNLTEINIPDSVMNISPGAFGGCYSLTTVHISETVRNRITNHDVFNGCYSLSDSYVENGIRYIDINDNVGTDFIRIEDKTLEEYTIKTNYLPGMYSSDIPNCKILRFTGEFTEITSYRFNGYAQLETVVLPSTLTSIGASAFQECTNLETLEIPNTVTTIGVNAFTSTKLSSIIIPEGVTEISDETFMNCTSLTEVTLPSTLTSIGASAFQECTNLETLEIPNTVTTIGVNAFTSTKLSSIIIPEGVTEISDETFMNCTSLTEVTLPSTLTSIGASAFQECTNLETLEIPNTVTTIGENAFAGTKLGYVENYVRYYDLTNETIILDFTDKTLEEYTIKNAVKTWNINNSYWNEFNNIKSITLPNSLEHIENNSFNNSKLLKCLNQNQINYILNINNLAISASYLTFTHDKNWYLNNYFYITSPDDEAIWWENSAGFNIEISRDNGVSWQTIAGQGYDSNTNMRSTKINIDANEIILFKSTSTPIKGSMSFGSEGGLDPDSLAQGHGGRGVGKFSLGIYNQNGKFIVGGNIMSLVYGDNFADKTSLDGLDNPFYNLFYNNKKEINIENLMLPATTLSKDCYGHMFYGCQNLIGVSKLELPATTLSEYCYEGMFYGCTSVTEAPELPATTLDIGCYRYMFKDCTSLVKAPKLVSTQLTNVCYKAMFKGCTSLTEIIMLSSDTNNYFSNYLSEWLSGNNQHGILYKNPNLSAYYSTTSRLCLPNIWSIQDYVETT